MKISSKALVWGGLAGILCGCDPQTQNQAVAAPLPQEENVQAAAVAEAPTDAGTRRSAHFDTVAQHLDLGGTFMGYVDVEGDLDRLLDLAQEFMDTLRQQGLGEIPEIQLKEMVSELGLNSITAMGASSVPTEGGGFRNQAFIHTPDGPKGLLTLFGAEAKPLVTLSTAPAGADLVIEQEFQLAALKDIVLGVYKQLPKDQGIPPVDMLMQQPLPGLGMTVENVLDQANGRFSLIAKFDPEEKVVLPAGPRPIEIPAVDLLIKLDGLGWVFEKLQGFIPQQGPFVREDTEAFTKLSVQIPAEVPFAFFQPVLVHDKKGNSLTLVSRPQFLEACAPGEGDKLAADEDFQKIAQGLPTEGNGFSYISPRVKQVVSDLVGRAMEQEGAPEGVAEIFDMVLANLGSMATVTVKKPNGVHSIANSPASFKSSLLSFAVVPMAVVGFSSRQSMVQMEMAQAQALQAQADLAGNAQAPRRGANIAAADQMDGMKKAIAALRAYAVANNGSFPDTVADLTPDHLSEEDADEALQWMTPNGAEPLVYFSGLTVASANNPIVLASPVPDENKERAVAHIDGTTETVSEDDFFKLARAALEQAN